MFKKGMLRPLWQWVQMKRLAREAERSDANLDRLHKFVTDMYWRGKEMLCRRCFQTYVRKVEPVLDQLDLGL